MTKEQQIAELEKQCLAAKEACFLNGEINEQKVTEFRALVVRLQQLRREQ